MYTDACSFRADPDVCVCYKQKLRTGREGGVEAKYHRQDQGRLSLALASCEEGETEEETRGKKISSEAEKETGGKKEHQHMSHWYVKRYPTGWSFHVISSLSSSSSIC